MSNFRKQIALAAVATAALQASALHAADGRAEVAPAETIIVTDFRGKPPFRRNVVRVEEAADFARFEERTRAENVWVVDSRGRPPFKRSLVSADEIADIARFEESKTEATGKAPRRGPPGKLVRRR